MMKSLLTLSLLALVFVLGCGGGGESTPTPASLEDRLAEYKAAFDAGMWQKVHALSSPAFRDECSPLEFGRGMTTGLATVRALMGAKDDAKVTYDVKGTREEGDIGYVNAAVLLDGTPVSEYKESPSWVHVDGEWWAEDEEWTGRGCE
jgi:hypothetical protein